MNTLKGFVAGALAVIFFHQPALALLKAAGLTQRGAYAMEPTRPFGVPVVASLTFWGGLWGIVFVLAVARSRFASASAYWIMAILFGAVAPTLVAWFVAAPLKGQPIGGGFKPSAMATALLVNAAWGLGTALLLRLLKSGELSPRTPSPPS